MVLGSQRQGYDDDDDNLIPSNGDCWGVCSEKCFPLFMGQDLSVSNINICVPLLILWTTHLRRPLQLSIITSSRPLSLSLPQDQGTTSKQHPQPHSTTLPTIAPLIHCRWVELPLQWTLAPCLVFILSYPDGQQQVKVNWNSARGGFSWTGLRRFGSRFVCSTKADLILVSLELDWWVGRWIGWMVCYYSFMRFNWWPSLFHPLLVGSLRQ